MKRNGPAPTPTAILKLRGSWRAKIRKNEPQPEPGVPRCPRGLDPVAKAKWKQLVPKLDKMGVLTQIDGDALENYCNAWSRLKKAEKFVAKHGESFPIRGRNGEIKYFQPFTQVQTVRNMMLATLRYQQEFGMTASSRTRIEVSGGEAKGDKFDGFLNRKGKRKTG